MPVTVRIAFGTLPLGLLLWVAAAMSIPSDAAGPPTPTLLENVAVWFAPFQLVCGIVAIVAGVRKQRRGERGLAELIVGSLACVAAVLVTLVGMFYVGASA